MNLMKILLLFAFLVLSPLLNSQSLSPRKLDKVKNYSYKFLLDEKRRESMRYSQIGERPIMIVPYFEVHLNKSKLEYIPSNLIKYNCVIDSVAFFVPDIGSPGLKLLNNIENSSNSIDPYYKMIKFCSMFSKYVFIIGLRKRNYIEFQYSEVVAAFIVNNSIKIVDRKLRIYNTIFYLCPEIYGSFDKYYEILLEDSLIERTVRKMSFNQMKNFIYANNSRNLGPTIGDTLKGIDLFMSQLDSFVKPTQSQIKKLRYDLFNDSSYYKLDIFDRNFDVDSRRIIRFTLTNKQYWDYDQMMTITKKMQVRIWNILRNHYENKNLHVTDKLDKYFLYLFLGRLN